MTVQQRLMDMKVLGRGELETITICQARGWCYVAIDWKAIAYARSLGITTFALRVILRWTSYTLISSNSAIPCGIQPLSQDCGLVNLLLLAAQPRQVQDSFRNAKWIGSIGHTLYLPAGTRQSA